MFTHRHLMFHLACTSAILTADLLAQQPALRPTTAVQIGATYNQERTEETKNNVRVTPGQDRKRGELAAPRPTNSAHVMPGEDRNQAPRVHPRPNQIEVPSAERRILPGAGRNTTTTTREVIVPERSAQRNNVVVPSRSARVQGQVINRSEHIIPGSRKVGIRPVVVQRNLPRTIVIDKRCAPCPYVALTPYAISKKGDIIELDDGSIWDVRHRDRHTVKRWRDGDILLIETGRFYSWSTYKLTNYTRNETVDVEISMSSEWGGRSSHYIVEINGMQGYVRLEDGSTWRMSARDLEQWRIGDDVIIGLSKDWFSNQYTYLLINPRAKNRIIAMFEF